MAEALQQGEALPEATHQDMANAIRALAMDAVQKADFRPSRHAHGHGRCGHRAVHALPEIRRRPPRLAGPRPLRALSRPRLDAALCAALPHRRSRHGCGTAQALPPAWIAHAWSSRIWPRAGHRDHDRPVGAGARQRRRHGARRAAAQQPLWRGDRKPPHLRHRRRRLPHGGHQPGGDLACRSSQARPPDRAVRR